MLQCGNNTKCIVTVVLIFLHMLYLLVYHHMKTLKNLWAGNVEDEDEYEGYPVTSSVSD